MSAATVSVRPALFGSGMAGNRLVVLSVVVVHRPRHRDVPRLLAAVDADRRLVDRTDLRQIERRRVMALRALDRAPLVEAGALPSPDVQGVAAPSVALDVYFDPHLASCSRRMLILAALLALSGPGAVLSWAMGQGVPFAYFVTDANTAAMPSTPLWQLRQSASEATGSTMSTLALTLAAIFGSAPFATAWTRISGYGLVRPASSTGSIGMPSAENQFTPATVVPNGKVGEERQVGVEARRTSAARCSGSASLAARARAPAA